MLPKVARFLLQAKPSILSAKRLGHEAPKCSNVLPSHGKLPRYQGAKAKASQIVEVPCADDDAGRPNMPVRSQSLATDQRFRLENSLLK